MRHVIGIPARKIRHDDPNHATFLKMVAWILLVPNPYVFIVSSPPFLWQTCPGGMEYMTHRGFGIYGNPTRVPVRDFSRYWAYQDAVSGATIRSLDHLYSAVESDLKWRHRNGQSSDDVFLLTSGDPLVGNSFVDMWMERHGSEVRIHRTPSPIHMAADWVEQKLGFDKNTLARYCLLGTDVVGGPGEELERLSGLILILSVENDYRRSSMESSLAPNVFSKLARCYGPQTPVYACHVGYDRDINFCSTLEKITPLTESSELRAQGPYTYVVYRD